MLTKGWDGTLVAVNSFAYFNEFVLNSCSCLRQIRAIY